MPRFVSESFQLVSEVIKLAVHDVSFLGDGADVLRVLFRDGNLSVKHLLDVFERCRDSRAFFPVPDLRGYGDSDAPDGVEAYAKREMALDIVGLMDALGLERVHVLGHDRGARVSYRLALDHPDRVDRLGIIEIVPTGDFWAAWDAELALAAYHWTFLAQPAPLPERMILADGPAYMDWTLDAWSKAPALSAFGDAALESYRAQGADPMRVGAMCNDYRAGATIDRRIDAESRAAGAIIQAPLLFLWAAGGFPARTGDPLGVWRDWANNVVGQEIDGSGHFMMEEVPEPVLEAVLAHFAPPV